MSQSVQTSSWDAIRNLGKDVKSDFNAQYQISCQKGETPYRHIKPITPRQPAVSKTIIKKTLIREH